MHTWGIPLTNIQSTYIAKLESDFDAYLRTMSARSRQKIKRAVRRFSDLASAEVSVRSFQCTSEVDDLHAELIRIREKSWHAKVGSQVLPTAGYLKAIASHGWLRAYVLSVGNDGVSSVLGFQYGGTYYYESPAYDQAWQEHSPGSGSCCSII